MNTNFSLSRIKLLLRADWIEHKKSFLLSMGVLLLIWLFLLFVGEVSKTNTQAACFFIGGLIMLNNFFRHAGQKVHKQKNRYYTLPASTVEKYTTLLLEGCIYIITYVSLYFFGLMACMLYVPESIFIALSSFFNHNGSESGLLLFLSLVFLSYLTFRKHALLIAIAGLVAYTGLFVGVFARLVLENTITWPNYFNSSFIPDTFRFLSDYYTLVMLISTLIVMYIGYLKLKEKELR